MVGLIQWSYDVNNTRFQVGDKVWVASFGRKAVQVECPDCAGERRVRVMLADDTLVYVCCPGCQVGCDPPTGYITNYKWTAEAELRTVVGVQESAKDNVLSFAYTFEGSWYDDRWWTFATEAQAVAKAHEFRQVKEADENKTMMAKTKDYKSWAWNASYHRREAKEAKRKLEYHTAKAAICESHKMKGAKA